MDINWPKVFIVLSDNMNFLQMGGCALMLVLFVYEFINNNIINMATLVFLCHLSIKSQSVGKNVNNTSLVRNWICFSFVLVTEYLTGFILGFFFESLFYSLLKIIGLFVCSQNTMMSHTLYESYILPGSKYINEHISNFKTALIKYSEQLNEKEKYEKNDYNLYNYFQRMFGQKIKKVE
jgi:hypothetical protein